jgi:hypothetical protein
MENGMRWRYRDCIQPHGLNLAGCLSTAAAKCYKHSKHCHYLSSQASTCTIGQDHLASPPTRVAISDSKDKTPNFKISANLHNVSPPPTTLLTGLHVDRNNALAILYNMNLCKCQLDVSSWGGRGLK